MSTSAGSRKWQIVALLWCALTLGFAAAAEAQSITFSSPVAGNAYSEGQTLDITWTLNISTADRSRIYCHDLDYTVGNGPSVYIWENCNPGSQTTLSYRWVVPAGNLSSQVHIRARELDVFGNVVVEGTSPSFAIVANHPPSSLTVLSITGTTTPGGTTVATNQYYTVRMRAIDADGNLDHIDFHWNDGSDSPIEFVQYEQIYGRSFEDMRRRVPDLRKIGRMVGYKPEITLDSLLEMTIRDMCERLGRPVPSGMATA